MGSVSTYHTRGSCHSPVLPEGCGALIMSDDGRGAVCTERMRINITVRGIDRVEKKGMEVRHGACSTNKNKYRNTRSLPPARPP